MSIVCAISGDIPEIPVVSHVSGHVFEKRLLEKWVDDKGTDPVTNEPLSMEQTTDIKNSESVIRPRAPTWTSIPGILKCLQDEWDALMLHQYSLRDQLQNSRQELSHSLYQHDASCRVIARLQRDAADAKEALATLRPISENEMYKLTNGHIENLKSMAIEQPQVTEAEQKPDKIAAVVNNEDTENSPVPLHVVEEIIKINEDLTKSRKKRQKDKNAFPNLAKTDEIMNFSANFDYAGFHSTSHPGILSVAIDEEQFPGHLLTGGVDKTGILFNCADESIVKTLKGHSKKITKVLVHPSEPMAITASVDQSLKLWALNCKAKFAGDTECVCLESFNVHSATVSDMSLHPIPNYMFTVGYDGVWNFLDLPSSSVLTQIKKEEIEYTSCKVHPDGRIFAAGTNNGSKSSILIWDISEREQVHEFEGHTDAVVSISFSDNGYLMSTGSRDGSVRIWDLRRLKCREAIPIMESSAVNSVTFDDSGSYLAASCGNDVQIFSTGKQWNELTKLEGHKEPITSLVFGKDAKNLYSASMDNTVVKYYLNEELEENFEDKMEEDNVQENEDKGNEEV